MVWARGSLSIGGSFTAVPVPGQGVPDTVNVLADGRVYAGKPLGWAAR